MYVISNFASEFFVPVWVNFPCLVDLGIILESAGCYADADDGCLVETLS